jgi:hypothetical protein
LGGAARLQRRLRSTHPTAPLSPHRQPPAPPHDPQATALEFYGDLFYAGRLPEPARVAAPIIRAFALSGDIAQAQSVLDEGARDGARLDAGCFNGLLAGLVKHMAPPGEEDPGSGAAPGRRGGEEDDDEEGGGGGPRVQGDVIYGMPLSEQ